jgi:futalosine hydrolase
VKRVLIIVAVSEEAHAISSALGASKSVGMGPLTAERVHTPTAEVTVIAGGIGPAAAGAATSIALMADPAFDHVISAGIGGGFEAAGVQRGEIVVASQIVFADLGAHSPEKFLDATSLGWSGSTYSCNGAFVAGMRSQIANCGLRVHAGSIITVAAATGTDARANDLFTRYHAYAEGMEGAGVAHAATVFGKPMLEVRAISNAVGDRNVAAWDIPRALSALSRGASRIVELNA